MGEWMGGDSVEAQSQDRSTPGVQPKGLQSGRNVCLNRKALGMVLVVQKVHVGVGRNGVPSQLRSKPSASMGDGARGMLVESTLGRAWQKPI